MIKYEHESMEYRHDKRTDRRGGDTFNCASDSFKVKQMSCLLDEASDNMALDEGEWA